METGIRTVKNRVCRTVSAAQATPGGSHTATAGAERRRYRTAPEGAATGSKERGERGGGGDNRHFNIFWGGGRRIRRNGKGGNSQEREGGGVLWKEEEGEKLWSALFAAISAKRNGGEEPVWSAAREGKARWGDFDRLQRDWGRRMLKYRRGDGFFYEKSGNAPPDRKRHNRSQPRQKSAEQRFQETERYCFRVLCDYLRLLEHWKTTYAPQPQDAIWHPLLWKRCRG